MANLEKRQKCDSCQKVPYDRFFGAYDDLYERKETFTAITGEKRVHVFHLCWDCLEKRRALTTWQI